MQNLKEALVSSKNDFPVDTGIVMSDNQDMIIKQSIDNEANKVKKTLGLFGDIVHEVSRVVAPIVSIFGKKYTMPVVAISHVAEQFGKLNDEDLNALQNNVIGLSKLIQIIEDEVNDVVSGRIEHVNIEHVKSWLIELKSVNELRKLNNKLLD